jgi:hypothetical protein
MNIIKATSPTDAWLQSHRYLLDSGNKKVMNESINMVVEIEDNFDIDKTFDSTFREIFHLNNIHLWMGYSINKIIYL